MARSVAQVAKTFLLHDGRAPFVAVFLFAFLARLVFVAQWHDMPYGGVPWLDAQAYDEWAKAIASGELLRGKAFYQSPLYPYFLGLLYALFGAHGWIAGIVQALMGAATAALLAHVAAKSFGRVAGWAAGLSFALYRPSIFFTAPLMKEPLCLLLLAAFLVLVFKGLDRQRGRDYALCGAALGFGVLVRGNLLLLAPVTLVMFVLFRYPYISRSLRLSFRRNFLFGRNAHERKFNPESRFLFRILNGIPDSIFFRQGAKRKCLRNDKRRERDSAISFFLSFLIAMTLAIAPATLHNYWVSGTFIPVNYADGFNLYIGNGPEANGSNQYPPEVSTDPIQEEMNTIWAASEAMGHPAGPREVSAYWRGKALDAMMADPMRTLMLMGDKFVAFWNGAEQFDNYDASFIEKNFNTILSWPLVPFWLVTSLAAFGVVMGWRTNRRAVAVLGAFALAYMATVLIFYVTDRYRLPVVVFLMPLAGAGVSALIDLARQRMPVGPKRLCVGLTLAGLFLFLGLRPPQHPQELEAFNWGTLSMIYSDLEQDDKALVAFDKATVISPTGAGASAYVRVSYALERLGREDRARATLERAVALFPDNGIVLYNLARFMAARQQLAEALPLFEKARQLSPFYLLTYYALAKGYLVRGDTQQALAYARAGLKIDPTNPLLNEAQTEILGKSETAP